jgi:phospholipase/carboxylesterase
LSSALNMLASLLDRLESEHRLAADQIVLLGFSQGACLTVEYAARNARQYGGVAGLSGGLIGPKDTDRDYHGHFSGTLVFLGCSDIDPHIPLDRVHETSRVLSAHGAVVTERIYPGMGHTINDDEIKHVRAILASFATRSAASSSL